MKAMKTVRDYGKYAQMVRSPAIRKLIRIFNEAAKAAHVRYLVIGGTAVYLQTLRNPEDHPDLDIIIDSDKAGALSFMAAVRRKTRSRVEMVAETESDVFFKMVHGGHDVDVFTSQEERPFLGIPVLVRGVPVRCIEGLIMEKLSRCSYPDILMLFDLLRKKYDRDLVNRYAIEINSFGRLGMLQKIVRSGMSVARMRAWAASMSGGERRDHFVSG